MTESAPINMAGNCETLRETPRIALALGGGGARAAYQVGVLRAVGRLYPDLRIPVLTGVSAGAINISHLANHTGTFHEKIESLSELWRSLQLDNVFATSGPSLLWRALRVGIRLALGHAPGVRGVHGMVDTQPLRLFLRNALHAEDGCLPGIKENIERGRLDAVALTAISYGTGDTVTFHQGQAMAGWGQMRRRNIKTPLSVEHVMASAALPLFFPPIQIDEDWYGDGGIRLVSPLAPALLLGANRILAISNHYVGGSCELRPVTEPPSPATVLSSLYNAVFLDQLDHDVVEMQMINKLVRKLSPERRIGFRDIKLLVIRPSEDVGAIAYKLRHQLPPTLRHLLGRLGAGDIGSQDFLSTVLFHRTFIEQMMQVGERDGESQAPRIRRFFES